MSRIKDLQKDVLEIKKQLVNKGQFKVSRSFQRLVGWGWYKEAFQAVGFHLELTIDNLEDDFIIYQGVCPKFEEYPAGSEIPEYLID